MDIKTISSEFKAFILKGNVVDLAVGVVIGAGFGKVVDSVVKDLITPLIGALGGQPDFSAIRLGPLGFGSFVNAVLAFLILRSVRAARASVRVAFSEASREHKPDARRVDPAEHIAQEIERDAQAVGRLLRSWLYETGSRN